jgi:hypothetical protein
MTKNQSYMRHATNILSLFLSSNSNFEFKKFRKNKRATLNRFVHDTRQSCHLNSHRRAGFGLNLIEHAKKTKEINFYIV